MPNVEAFQVEVASADQRPQGSSTPKLLAAVAVLGCVALYGLVWESQHPPFLAPTSVPTPATTAVPTPVPPSVPTPATTAAPTPEPHSVQTLATTAVPTPVPPSVQTPATTAAPTQVPPSVQTPADDAPLSISLLAYNVEFEATYPKRKGTTVQFSKKQLAAMENVATYLAAEDADIVVVPEGSRWLMDYICRASPGKEDDLRNQPFNLGLWAHPRASGSKSCGYLVEYEGWSGLGIVYNADKYTVTRRSCNYGKNKHKDKRARWEVEWQKEMAQWKEHCVDLQDNQFSRVDLFVNFRPKDGAIGIPDKDVLVVGTHWDHRHHHSDVLSLAKALNIFTEASRPAGGTDDPAKGPLFILGDMNTHANVGDYRHNETEFRGYGIHKTQPELVALGVKERRTKTATFSLTGPSSLNEALQPWLDKHGYGSVKDAADKPSYNKATGEEAAEADCVTIPGGISGWDAMEIDYSKLQSGPTWGDRLDHILFAVPKDWPAIETETFLGRPERPSSDHLPLSMRRFYQVA